ncbi:polyprenyl synthetase family protein, partial [Salmonella enterica]|uniref:polyprenyl synthetase family protein n=1 Tax=Salmonella enterica TaxID=28901 RepID=UPI00398C5406
RRHWPAYCMQLGSAHDTRRGGAVQAVGFSSSSVVPMPEVADRDGLTMIAEVANARGFAGMCGGQALDLAAEGQRLTLDALERIHRHKTGALIRAAVRLGSLSAGDTGRNTLPLLYRYAESIGLAFQFQYYLLDVVGHTATS